ncbi:MAG: hypothetical protein WAM70_10470 [Pyrinomonadaceae bacterium]
MQMAEVSITSRGAAVSLAILVAANTNVVPVNSLARKVERTQLRETPNSDYSALAMKAVFATVLATWQNPVSKTDYQRVASESISGNPNV